MNNTATDGQQAGPPLGLSLHDGLGPLPGRTLAEIHNPVTGERELSETGTAYYGSNWREVRKLYTADDVMAHGVQERAAERERWKRIADAAQAVTTDANDAIDFFAVPSHVMAALALALDEGPNVRANLDPTARDT